MRSKLVRPAAGSAVSSGWIRWAEFDAPMSGRLSRYVAATCAHTREGRLVFDAGWSVGQARAALSQLGVISRAEDGAWMLSGRRVSPSKPR